MQVDDRILSMPRDSKEAPRSPCVISNVLDIFGDRWTLLVIRDLFFFGKHEYKEFLNSPESIATNILSQRLKRLKSAGIIDEISHPSNKTRKLYYLTQSGKDLLPILLEMVRWGGVHLPPTEMMKPLYKRVSEAPESLMTEILHQLTDWEKRNLRAGMRSFSITEQIDYTH